MAGAGRILARCRSADARRPAPGSPRRARRGRREVHPLAGRRAGLQGLPRLPRLDLRVAELDGRPRHPGPYELERGDILSIDIGVVLDGWVADAAVTHPIGNVTPIARSPAGHHQARRFRRRRGARAGNRLGDVSHAVQKRVEGDGFSVIRSLVGHGIGRDMHEDPQIPNFGEPGTGPELEEGMVLAIEPMVNAGTTTCGWATTTGPSIPRTARWPPTSSTRWRSPAKARGS